MSYNRFQVAIGVQGSTLRALDGCFIYRKAPS